MFLYLQIYLVDYGLATKYHPDGKHKDYKEDPRKVHDGTIEFTSIDAHKGAGKSHSPKLGFSLEKLPQTPFSQSLVSKIQIWCSRSVVYQSLEPGPP